MSEINAELKEFMRMWLREYINEYCIVRVPPGGGGLKSPIDGDFMVWELYLSQGLYDPKFAGYVGMLFWERYAEEYKKKPFQIVAVEPRGISTLMAISATSSLFIDTSINFFTIREKRKEYALENIFEGTFDDSKPAMIVGEVSNEDDTFERARTILAQEGIPLYKKSFSIVNKDVAGNMEGYDRSIGPEYSVESLFTIRDFDYRYNDYIARNERYVSDELS